MPSSNGQNEAARPRQGFPRRLRVTAARQFARLRRSPLRKTVGPLTIYGAANDLTHPRLGLSVGRAVGAAPQRHRIKRLLRESFRLLQHQLPAGYDLLVSVRPHQPLPLTQYQDMLLQCAQSIHHSALARARRSAHQ